MAGVLSPLGAAPASASYGRRHRGRRLLMIVAALAATAAFGREELGTGLLLLIGVGAVVAAALRANTHVVNCAPVITEPGLERW
jgi:drug/metabolite transporter (DMT)-like permease